MCSAKCQGKAGVWEGRGGCSEQCAQVAIRTDAFNDWFQRSNHWFECCSFALLILAAPFASGATAWLPLHYFSPQVLKVSYRFQVHEVRTGSSVAFAMALVRLQRAYLASEVPGNILKLSWTNPRIVFIEPRSAAARVPGS
eukprot:1160831-Pelagomonas_calceolata.AAC.7